MWKRTLDESPQRRAIKKYRSRLSQRGMARFEIIGRKTDRELIRLFAKQLSEDSPNAERLRATMRRELAGEPQRKGAILQALRRSPLVGVDVIPQRPFDSGRKVDL